ncbi:dipeptidyl-peptidase-4 [Actinacidiphila yanglinensis]|uniref:Dipeptidyl-peptidase-4 n=1 Tax=Actinacidiphila yanglinensis TaxID=310779 RepID=A0A1H6EFW7_9ACTN|nr:prolyl oligopeptidase family serine peptidase [Actinacidiphila yanglinensis]SEG95879.1 dipeptidyl-peptidase-4 [Actinacidiphila yanglinensis]
MDTINDHRDFPGRFARTQRFSLGAPSGFTLTPDGSSVLFLRTRGPEDRVGCLWRLDGDGEHLLVDPTELADAAGEVPQAELIRRERARVRTSGIVGYATDADVRLVVFALDGALWTADPSGVLPPRRHATAGSVVDPRPDPAGRRVAYVTGGALHVLDLADGTDRALAEQEGDEVTYGLAEHVAAESMHRHRGYWWSPDGSRLLVARVDNSPVARWWISDPVDPTRPPREVAYPAAGTANADVSLHILTADGAGRTQVDWDRAAFEYVTAAAWDAHGPLLSVQSRDQKTLRVLAADPRTGATAPLHEQHDPAWVELVVGTPARTASGALVHTSDEGETRFLTVGGERVTPEGLQVLEVLSVDGESVLFAASDEPTEEHLWAYHPDDGAARLSEGPGVHTGQRAGGALLLSSRTDHGRVTRILRPGGVLEVRSLAAEPPVPPRVTWLRAGEHAIRTALVLPSWYRPGTEPLPVLLAPYGGPAMQLVVRAGGWWLAEAQWFAEEGFAVVIADGRGTPGRGPRWDKSIYKNTLDAPVEDQVTALRAAAAHCPDLDLERVAIRGWSFGGSLATMAVLRHPEVFHAAISGAGPSDQRLYDTHWRERFLGHPDEDPDAYDRCSPIGSAAALERPLLLVHGMADDNVVVAHTLRMSAALLAAGRFHQVLPLSQATHAPSDPVMVEGLLRHQLKFLRDSLNAAPRRSV